jgi:dTDP-4-dehydrorhamnose reductase
LLNVDFLNSDLEPKSELNQFEYIDLMDRESIRRCLLLYKPNMVINLASRTDDNGQSVFDYRVNFLGLANLIYEIEGVNEDLHLVHFSTQYVLAPKFSLPPRLLMRAHIQHMGKAKQLEN